MNNLYIENIKDIRCELSVNGYTGYFYHKNNYLTCCELLDVDNPTEEMIHSVLGHGHVWSFDTKLKTVYLKYPNNWI